MSFDVKKIFDSFYKKHKALTVAIIYILIVVIIKMSFSSWRKNVTKINIAKDTAIINTAKIDNIERQTVTQDVFTRDVVKRNSFNAYIKRKDEEYHQQMSINNSLYSKMGVLEGEVKMFSGLLDPFYFNQNHKEVDCE